MSLVNNGAGTLTASTPALESKGTDVGKPLVFGERPGCNQTKKGSSARCTSHKKCQHNGALDTMAPDENGFGDQNDNSDDSQKTTMATLGMRARRMRMNMMM